MARLCAMVQLVIRAETPRSGKDHTEIPASDSARLLLTRELVSLTVEVSRPEIRKEKLTYMPPPQLFAEFPVMAHWAISGDEAVAYTPPPNAALLPVMLDLAIFPPEPYLKQIPPPDASASLSEIVAPTINGEDCLQ